MDLDLTLIEQDRRHRIVVLRVNRRDLLINRRFTHTGHSQHPPHDAQTPSASGKSLSYVILEHRMHFTRRPGQQDDRRTLVIDKHPRRGAVRIRQYDSVFNHHRLTRIPLQDRKSTRLNSSHVEISYAVFCLKKKKKKNTKKTKRKNKRKKDKRKESNTKYKKLHRSKKKTICKCSGVIGSIKKHIV